MPTPKLQIDTLSKSFWKGDSEVVAVEDLTFDVADGEFVSIVGASGCGKTTILRLIDGLIKPTAGMVSIDGKPVTKPGRDIAFVFQNDGLLPWRTVMNNTVLGPEIQGVAKAAARRIGMDFLRLVGLSGFENHYPHELSGGMRQRVNLARALSVGSDVLLMDEPFASLDAQTREIMQGELMRISRETQKTVVLVTHQIDEAVYLSDRVIVLTARPGRFKQDIVVDLPRPRDLAVKRTSGFVEYVDKIWLMIEEEVREGIRLEAQNLATAHS
jgi:NitT/TauT family transport system ATP-binding protein